MSLCFRLPPRAGLSLFCLAQLLAAGSCGGGPSGPSEPTALGFKAGGNQTGAAGTVLAIKVLVEARNAHGPMPNVTIAVGVESPGGGSALPHSAVTDAQGTAQFTWTLGPKLGTQTLTASTTGATPLQASISATATPGPATVIVGTSELSQFIVVGTAVSSVPAVRVTDAFGNPSEGAAVSFEALQGGNVLTGADRVTDAAGVASVGSWTIGPDAIVYSIRARLGNGAVALFEARGIPATFLPFAGAAQSANAGTAVPVLPAVRAQRADGSPLPNVPVDFSVLSGGGSVAGGSTLTGVDGTARPVRWVLGPDVGLNRLEGRTAGRPAATFDATGTLAVPAAIAATSATALSGFFGNYLVATPEVAVSDAQGNPVAGQTVNFVAQGGGQLRGVSTQTDFLGRARVLSWRLGASGAQTLSATLGALPPVTFTATGSAPPPSTFRIEVRYAVGTTPSPTQRAAFDAAAARWSQLILAGAPPYRVVASDADPSGDCPSMLDELVDGIVIHVKFQNLGSPNILGATGVCIIRDEGFLPVQGLMLLNTGVLPSLETNGWLTDVITHEMAHALGYGTIWEISIPGLGAIHLTSGIPGSDPSFSGAAARAAFYGAVAPGTSFTGSPVPLEATGGPGTAYSHWRETVFKTELMTGFISPAGVFNPLSALSVDQFRDLGYVVNDAPADAYTFQAFLQAAVAQPGPQLVETPLAGVVTVINRSGTVVARVPRVFR